MVSKPDVARRVNRDLYRGGQVNGGRGRKLIDNGRDTKNKTPNLLGRSLSKPYRIPRRRNGNALNDGPARWNRIGLIQVTQRIVHGNTTHTRRAYQGHPDSTLGVIREVLYALVLKSNRLCLTCLSHITRVVECERRVFSKPNLR